MRTAVLAVVAAAVLLGQTIPAAVANRISIWYSHAYFVLAPDGTSGSVWEPGEMIAWSRWSFVLEGPDALFPVDLRVETNGFRLDPTIWHKPPLRVLGPSAYACSQSASGWDVTFSTTERPRVDPGVRISREVTPEIIPPGVSDVQVRVVVTLVRRPTIDGVGSPVRAASMYVYWDLSSGLVAVRDFRIDPGPWERSAWPNKRNNWGFWMGTDALPPGTFFTLSGVMTVENRSGHALLFHPRVDIQWFRETFALARISGRTSDSGALDWTIGGPQGGELRAAFSVQPGKHCAWHIEPAGHPSTIWIHWPGAIRQP